MKEVVSNSVKEKKNIWTIIGNINIATVILETVFQIDIKIL